MATNAGTGAVTGVQPHSGGPVRAHKLRYAQLLAIFAVFIAIAAALVYQQAGSQLKVAAPEASLRLLETFQIQPGGRVVDADCLVLCNLSEPSSVNAVADIEALFEQLSIEADYCDIAEDALPDLGGYGKAVLAVSDLTRMGAGVSDLMAWVYDGGQLLVYIPPEPNGVFQAFAQQFGIRELAPQWYTTPGIEFGNGLMVGGDGQSYEISDPYDSSLCVALVEDCTVYAVSADEKRVPLIWEYADGAGRVVFCNLSIVEKSMRGVYAQAFSLLGDAFAWPVIDGSAFYLDDFPAPVPVGSGEYIEADYGTSARNFYTNVWWPDLAGLARTYGIAYTGLIIEDYNDQVDPPFSVEQDVQRFEYFGAELTRLGGELGIHGFNHMPLVLEGTLEEHEGYVTGTYENLYAGYEYWPSREAIDAALEELYGFACSVFPQTEIDVYVPPSNILTSTGRAALAESPFEIRVIASTYFDSADHAGYTQDFEVAEDGIVETPRIISGGVLGDYMLLSALSELNLHFVNSHFMHPDDMLDEDRGAALGWATLFGNIEDYCAWLYGSAPQIRNLTGTEMGAAVQRWYDLAVQTAVEPPAADADGAADAGALVLELDGFHDEAFLFLRSHDALVTGAVGGGSVDDLGGGLYLVRATAGTVRIPKEAAQ